MKLKLSGQFFCFAIFWYQSHTEQRLFCTYHVSNVRWLKIDQRFGFNGAIIESILWGYSAGNISYGCSLPGPFLKSFSFTASLFKK